MMCACRWLQTAALALLVAGLAVDAHRNRGGVVATSVRSRQEAGEDASVSPVQRAVALLQKMKAELTAEAGDEEAAYEKMVCWCETSEKEKTQAVVDADAKDIELTSEIEGRSAGFGKMSAEIAELKKQIAEDTEALDQAMALREHTAGEFRGEEAELVQAIDNLRNAIAVLSKHHEGNLMQLSAPLVSGMRVVLRDAAVKYEEHQALAAERAGASQSSRSHSSPAGLLQTVARAHARAHAKAAADEGLDRLLLGALDLSAAASATETLPLTLAQRLVAQSAHPQGSSGATASFLEAPIDAAYKSYSARSGEIYGILQQMLKDFQTQLDSAQKEETKSAGDYEALATAKRQQIATAKEKLDEQEESSAANQKALFDAKEDLDLTRKQRSADVEFLQKLKLTCNDLDKDWEQRSATRTAELKAVAEAIAILTEDDNREMLAKSVSLVQLRLQEKASSESSAIRARVVEALQRAAGAPAFEAGDLLAAWHTRRARADAVSAPVGGPQAQLAALAVTAQLDSFTKLKELMDKMVAELKDQQKEEAEFKAYCVKEFDENEKAVYAGTERKKDLQVKLDSLASLIARLEKEIAAAKSQISATNLEMKQASQNREAENKEFQQTVSDQRSSQDILRKALQKLKDFYHKGIGKKVSFVQREVHSHAQKQTPPVQFNKYKVNAGSSSVMGLIEQIIEDSEALEKEATTSERKAQADYEQFTKDSNGMIALLSSEVVSKTKAIAGAKQETTETEGDMDSTISELQSLAAYEEDLHGQCDFVMKNFEIRQKARLEEIEAIQSAKAIISGQQVTR